jgi:hypothetical protein
MHPVAGWTLAVIALAVGWFEYGARGLALAASIVVFWLLLQLNRALRVMRVAGGSPVGRVESAVMLNARLRPGLQMLDVLTLTKSLGRRVDPARDDLLAWADPGGAEVIVSFRDGRCERWELRRSAETPE